MKNCVTVFRVSAQIIGLCATGQLIFKDKNLKNLQIASYINIILKLPNFEIAQLTGQNA